MNKEELVKSMSEKATKRTGLQVSKAIAKACLDGMIETIEERNKKREDVALVGFGTWSTADRAPRVGRNPKTKEPIDIPAKVVPTFSAGSGLRASTAKLKVRKVKVVVAKEPVATEAEAKTPKAPKAPKTPKTSEEAK
jgi:DNA-binding protein HU-beta